MPSVPTTTSTNGHGHNQSQRNSNNNNNDSSYENHHVNNDNSSNQRANAKLLADYGNLKNQFLIFGQFASYELLREGRLEESVQICSEVLAIDPSNEDMNILKEDISSIQQQQQTRNNNPAQSQSPPPTASTIKEQLLRRSESPIRRLRRSFSAVQQQVRRSAPFFGNHQDDGDDADANNNPHGGGSGSAAGGVPSKVEPGASTSHPPRRAQSLSAVSLKIIQFEQAEKDKANASTPVLQRRRRASVHPSEGTVMEVATPTLTNGSSSRHDSPFSTPPTQLPFPKTNSQNPNEATAARSINQEPTSPSASTSTGTGTATPTLSLKPVNSPASSSSSIVYNFRGGGALPEKKVVIISKADQDFVRSNSLPAEPSASSSSSAMSNTVAIASARPLQTRGQGQARQDGPMPILQRTQSMSAAEVTAMRGESSRALTRQTGSANLVRGTRVEWTEHGLTLFPPATRTELEQSLFSSDLITRACLVQSITTTTTTTTAAITTSSDEPDAVNIQPPSYHLLGLTPGFRIKPYEIQTILARMADSLYITSSKLVIGGLSYSCLSGTREVVRARIPKLGMGATCTKYKMRDASSTFLLVILYEHPVLPKSVSVLVSEITNILDP